MHWIANSFFAFLSGREVQTVSPIRSILAFKSDIMDSWNALTASGTTHSVAEDHQHEIVAGWLPTIMSGARQILWSAYEANSPRRQVNKSLFIPQCIIDHWVQEARREGIQVTEHDLLMGFIYEVCICYTQHHLAFMLTSEGHISSPLRTTSLHFPYEFPPAAPITRSPGKHLVSSPYSCSAQIQIFSFNPVSQGPLIQFPPRAPPPCPTHP